MYDAEGMEYPPSDEEIPSRPQQIKPQPELKIKNIQVSSSKKPNTQTGPIRVHMSLQRNKENSSSKQNLNVSKKINNFQTKNFKTPDLFLKTLQSPSVDINSIYNIYESLFNYSQEIENTLKAEMLNSEEQRSFIELLRNSLDKKLNLVGFKGNSDSFLMMENLEKQLNESKNQYDRLLNQTQENNINEKKLIEEKETLLEFVSEIKQINEQLQKQLNEKECEIESKNNEIDIKNDDLNNLNEEFESLKILSNEIETQRQNLLNKNKELILNNEENTRNIGNLIKELNSIKPELENLKEKNNQLNNSLENQSILRITLQETSSELNEIKNKYNSLENKLKEKESEILKFNNIKEAEIIRNENERKNKTEEILNLSKENSLLRTENRNFKEEFGKIEKEIRNFQEENNEFKNENDRYRREIHRLENEINEYKKLLEEREMSKAKLHTLEIKFQAEKENYEDSISQMRSEIRNLQDLCQEIDKEKSFIIDEKNRELEDLKRHKNNKSFSFPTEKIFKLINSMISDLRLNLGNAKLCENVRNPEKIDIENSLFELHDLQIYALNSIDELQNLLVNQNNTQNSNKQLEIEAKIRETDQKMYENEIRMQENEAKTEKIAKEKSCLYLVLKKIRNMIIEEEIRNCFDEFLATSIEITRLELQKTEILIQNEEKTEFDRRKLNEINIEIEKMYRKKDILENDLSKIELFDRKRENSRRKNSVDNSSLRKSEVFETKNLGKNPSESGFKSIEFNKPQIVREFSSGKYVSYGDNKLEKNIPNFSLNTMGDLRSKLLARNNKYF